MRQPVLRIVLGIMLMAGGGLGQTNSPSLSGDLLRRAYLAVVDAELARCENRPAEAMKAYRQALELYGRLQAEYPGWQGDAVGYRIADCQNALIALDPEKTPDDEIGMAVEQANDTNATVRLARLVKEIEGVRSDLAFGSDSREGGPVAAALVRELEGARAERDEAERATQSLQRRLVRLEGRTGSARESGSTNQTVSLVSTAIRAEARRLMEAGDNAGAQKLLQEARVIFPEDAELRILLGVAACRAGQFQDAVVVLKPFDTKGATQANALLTLGTAYMGLGRVGDARVITEKALRIDAKSPEANYNMAQILLSVVPAEPAAAQQYYSRAVELGLPGDADLENSLRMATILSRIKKRAK